jgi:hypothetical protein
MLSTFFILLIFSGCNLGDDCFCTEIFMMQMVQVVDQTGQLIDGVSVTISFTESQNTIDCSQYHDASNGLYCILNDNYVEQLDEDGKSLSVMFEKTGYVTRVEIYYFNTDKCQCHINLLGGETTVVLLEGCSDLFNY